MLSDIEIAHRAEMRKITEIAAELGIGEDALELFGQYKAKLPFELLKSLESRPSGKLILVTAMTPTPAGEGKSTTTVGLAQGLKRIGKRVAAALREPSLGPCMGLKGGAAGGGYAQVIPMEDINLHFTGDFHAVTSAHMLLSAMLDNHIHQGNALRIDARRIVWRRAVDMNDRALRSIVVGLGGQTNGVPRQDGFDISVASEVMAILCLAADMRDLKSRLARIVVAYDADGQPVTAGMLRAAGAMAALLRDAIKPNLVQTIENVPALIHGGPFANIAHGCNSVIATKAALKLADYVVTEAGFGADLGAEKFFDIKCRSANLSPDAAVIVATARALKMHAGVSKQDLGAPNPDAVRRGMPNLEKHIDIVRQFGVPAVVAVNRFAQDSDEEIAAVFECCERAGARAALSRAHAAGGAGCEDLAREAVALCENAQSRFAPIYDLNMPICEKIETIARRIYGAAGVAFGKNALAEIKRFEAMGYGNLPVCMAKTQYSLSDSPSLRGRPKDFDITVRSCRLSAGAGFVVALAGEIMTMPGLPKSPAAERIDVSDGGVISGLF